MLDDQTTIAFRETGVVVLRGFFDPEPLALEVGWALADARRRESASNKGSAGNAFQYVPMMCERTPVSLALLDALAAPAAELLGRDVIPTRAKGTRYFGGTSWHRDSDMDVASVGLAAYLEPLDPDSGALRVIRGSHLSDTATPSPDAAGAALSTEPGDVIVFDEHLFHSSVGGHVRHQWRVDFVVDPVRPEEEIAVRSYFARIFPLEWDGGYDFDRYPSYGKEWRFSDRPWSARLGHLGVYELADAEEWWMRMHPRGSGAPSGDPDR